MTTYHTLYWCWFLGMYLRKGRALRAYSTHCLWKERRSEGTWRKSGGDSGHVAIKGRTLVKSQPGRCSRALLTHVACNGKHTFDFSGIPCQGQRPFQQLFSRLQAMSSAPFLQPVMTGTLLSKSLAPDKY